MAWVKWSKTIFFLGKNTLKIKNKNLLHNFFYFLAFSIFQKNKN